MLTEKELDFLEEQIPHLAEYAFHKAYLDALSKGRSVLEACNGKIFEVYPDGSKKIIKSITADRLVAVDDQKGC